jgi:hypothetical protein
MLCPFGIARRSGLVDISLRFLCATFFRASFYDLGRRDFEKDRDESVGLRFGGHYIPWLVRLQDSLLFSPRFYLAVHETAWLLPVVHRRFLFPFCQGSSTTSFKILEAVIYAWSFSLFYSHERSGDTSCWYG